MNPRRGLTWLSGAAFAAALVLCGVAAVQTLRLVQMEPAGARVTATVLAREMLLPAPGAALSESTVTLLVTDPELGTFTATTPHPPASLTEVWEGGPVAVTVDEAPGGAQHIAYRPTLLAARHRATLIALALALALGAGFAIAARLTRFP